MSLLLDALKRAEREQGSQVAADWLHNDAQDAGRSSSSAVPLLQHGIYVPQSVRRDHEPVATPPLEPAAVSVPPLMVSRNDQLAFAATPVKGSELWHMYLVLMAVLVLLMTVGTYAYYRYVLVQHTVPWPTAAPLNQESESAGAMSPPIRNAMSAAVPSEKSVPAAPQSKQVVQVKPKATPRVAPVVRQAEVAKTVAPPVAQPAAAPARDPMVIIRKDSENVGALLARAYQSYVRENYEGARILYEEVLRSQEMQRDALLGLAAIALRREQFGVAGEYYRTLLRSDPLDESAIAGLVSSLRHEDPVQARQVIVDALQQAPQSAILHFTLGTLYLSTGQWRNAQQALQQAVRLDDRNADFVFNLGVSYDRMAEYGAAMHAYRRALQLATQYANAGFRQIDVEKRLRQLASQP